MTIFPALFIVLTVLALNFIGDGVLSRYGVRVLPLPQVKPGHG